MNALTAFLVWAGVGGGVALMVAGLRGYPVVDVAESGDGPGSRRLALVGATAVLPGVVLVITGSWALVLLCGVALWVAPRLRSGRAARDEAIARTEAIASWTEMIRDSIVAAAGLEEAIVATGPVAPEAISREVGALANRLDPRLNVPLPEALHIFGAEVRHPSADLVVAALVIAARMEASDLSGLLSRLADAIRGDARMRIRVEVGRARLRTAARVIVGVVGATILLLAATNLDYLRVYNRPAGQLVLLGVGAIFAVGAWLLDRMATIETPERFAARTTSGAVPWS